MFSFLKYVHAHSTQNNDENSSPEYSHTDDDEILNDCEINNELIINSGKTPENDLILIEYLKSSKKLC